MKTTKGNNSKILSNSIVAIKAISFFVWISLIAIATANGMLIESFLLSAGLGIMSYFIFGITARGESDKSSKHDNSGGEDNGSTSHNYLSVFFHGRQQEGRQDGVSLTSGSAQVSDRNLSNSNYLSVFFINSQEVA